MKAVMLYEPGRLEPVELPDPSPRPGEVVLAVEACAVCGSDLEGFHGIHPTMTYPRVMGHEYAGVVVRKGEGVEAPAVGERVTSVGKPACGRCHACERGRFSECVDRKSPGFTGHGAYAEYLAVPAESCRVIPAELSFEEAAVAQPFSIAYHAVAERAKVARGDFVLVQGCGPIGLGVMMHAKARGAEVMSTDPVAYRRELAAELGADHVADPRSVDVSNRTAELTGGLGADTAIECVGADQDDTVAQAVRSVKDRGLVVVVGSFATDRATVPIIDFKFNEKRMVGSQSMPEGYGPTFDLLVSGAIVARPLITHRYGLDGVVEALRLMDGKLDGIVKAIIRPGS